MIIEWDLSKLSAIDDRVKQVHRELGDVDIIFNNTGGPPPSSAIGQGADLWTQQFEAMVLSVIKITDAFLPGMRQRRWGRILTSTSSGVIAPIHNLAISNVLPSSLLGWSKTLSAEVAADGVTANIIVPGKIETARLRSLTETTAARTNVSFEEVTAKSVDAIPMKRFGSPHEYAAPAVFLMSERASYITGSVFRVDGGGIPSI